MPDSTMTTCGTLTADPELRFTQGGSGACTFRIAVAHRYKRQGSNEWEEETSFINCKTFGSLAENVAASCAKGTRVIVTGRLSQRDWDNNDGSKGSALEIAAEDVAVSLRWATAGVEKNPRRETNR